MRISIITPSYMQSEYIKETIVSVITQSISNLDYIVIDGGSYDESVDVIKKYSNKIAFWSSEVDRGQSHAINKGLVKVSGDIVNWLNSDDYYETDALSIVLRHFSVDGTRAVFGKSRLFNEKDTIGYSRGTDIYPNNLPKTIGWARIDQPESFFLRTAWDKVGLLNESLHYCMDREWWMRYLYHFGLEGIIKIPDVLVNFRIHNESKTSSHKTEFFREHHSIFYQLGLAANEKASLDMISQNIDIDKSIPTDIRHWKNISLCKQSFHYYLLKSADEFYAQDRMELSKEFLRSINPVFLQHEDRRLLQKLKIRVRLPLSFIHFFRNS